MKELQKYQDTERDAPEPEKAPGAPKRGAEQKPHDPLAEYLKNAWSR
ncbi:MAG: hypothetical protein MRY74_13675 [Neomegalonema sp.]|nr:hypothetical protein [Neomegalonema sp.]